MNQFFYAEHDSFLREYLKSYITRNILATFKNKNERQEALVDLVENWPIKSERNTLEQVVLEFVK